jgi:hypothetical protein
MSAAALAQRLRTGAVPGLNQAERNGWNAGANVGPYRENQAATEGETPDGTARTGGTGISVGVCRNGEESRPEQAANDAQAPAPARDPYAIGASWRPLAAAYYRHHFTCPNCKAAGRGHGDRCTAGAELWASYEAASEAAHDTNARRISK